jgi:predicted metalloprotease with PDZ domain
MVEAAEPVKYTVRFPSPVLHYAEVEATFPSPTGKPLQVFLPVWTPGSYLVREYARNIENIRAFDGAAKSLVIQKTRKNRWMIEPAASASVRVEYRVYCREMTVRTNWVDENFALLNGAATFISPVGDLHRPYQVIVELPSTWRLSISGLPEMSPNHFEAPDYDTLVDSPILAGSPAVHEFVVDGKKHFLVNQGETALWDGPRSVRDTRKIVEQNLKMWGSLPYEKYVFLNLIVDSGGGLEHKNSVCMMTGRYATRTRRAYLGWLGLVSHEYFHAWNVKRLRPVELGPFDYENENYTQNLWVAEGFTDYYTGLNLRRAGLSTDAEYLMAGPPGERDTDSLSAQIDALQTTPGRLTQPLERASYDAWIKAYRPDENSANTSVNYYVKGGLVGWLLDARIRHLTDGKKTLDDGMRLAFQRYSGVRGYTTPQFVAAMSETAGTDLIPWFEKALQTTEEFDYTEALEWFGLEFKKPEPPKADNRLKAWIGFVSKNTDGRFVVSQVPRDTPAETAGLSVDDEILAVDNWRVTSEGWAQRLQQYAPGDTVELLISRRDQMIRVPIKLGEEPGKKWQLEINPQATDEQKLHLKVWLNG